jgi:hypothetical protein
VSEPAKIGEIHQRALYLFYTLDCRKQPFSVLAKNDPPMLARFDPPQEQTVRWVRAHDKEVVRHRRVRARVLVPISLCARPGQRRLLGGRGGGH